MKTVNFEEPIYAMNGQAMELVAKLPDGTHLVRRKKSGNLLIVDREGKANGKTIISNKREFAEGFGPSLPRFATGDIVYRIRSSGRIEKVTIAEKKKTNYRIIKTDGRTVLAGGSYLGKAEDLRKLAFKIIEMVGAQ